MKQDIKKNFTKSILHLAGLVLLIVILSRLDLSKILETLSDTNLSYFFLATPIILISVLSRTIRWQFFLKKQNIKLSLKEAFLVYFYAIFWGMVTPARSGEFGKIFYLKKKGYSYKDSFINTIADRLFDVGTVLLLGFVGLLFFADLFQKELYILSAGIVLFIFIALITTFLKKDLISSWAKNLIKIIDTKTFIICTALSILAWLLYFLQIYLFSLSLSLTIPFFFIALAMSISSLLNLLPITISGIGTRDLVFILIFGHIGIAKEDSIALSTLTLSIFLVSIFSGWLAGFFLQEKRNSTKINS